MNQNKFSFESENFQVDFLTFNTQFNDQERIQKIADYFSDTFQCNSIFIDLKDSKQNRTLIKKHKNYCSAEFRANYTKYWSGTHISFSGNHARYFYKAIAGKELDWDILDFEDTNLGRIDLCYDRKLKQSDQIENNAQVPIIFMFTKNPMVNIFDLNLK